MGVEEELINDDAVISAIRTLSGSKTIVMVAHRVTTIQECDQFFVVDERRVREQGSYDQLLGNDGAFAALTRSVPQ